MSEVVPRNIAVLAGVCSAPATTKVLESGTTLCQFAVRVPGGGNGANTSVPVACFDPPAWCADLVEGDGVIVLGKVRRRFYRAGAATGSRVEVEAERIARATDRRAIAAIVRRIGAAAGELAS